MEWQSPSPICFGALSQVQEDFIFPTVPVGVNTVEVRGFLDGVQQSIMTGSFTATTCCASQASFTANITSRCTADQDSFLFTNTSTGATSQEWYINNVLSATSLDFAPSLTSSGIYAIKLKVTDGACADSVTQVVNVYQTPSVNLGPDIQTCVNTFETLDAGPGQADYNWSSTTTNTQTINVTSTGFYNVVVTSTIGCMASDTIEVTFNPLPIVDLGNDTSICENQSLMLDAGDFSGYSWNTGDTTQFVEAGNGGQFTVTVVDSNSCENSDDLTVTLIVSPVVDLGADSISICPGDSTSLDTGTHSTYNWNTGATTQMVTAKSNQLYTVEVSNANNCTASDSVYVDFHTSPVVSLGLDQTICYGDDASFNAGAFASYTWSDNSAMQTLTLDSSNYVLGQNSISVTVIDTNGCSGQGSVALEVLDCDTATGIHDIPFTSQVSVYPNPTSNALFIDIANSIDDLSIAIFDLNGKTIMSNTYKDVRHISLNLEKLHAGLYFLEMRNGNQVEIQKISKK